MDTSKLQKFVDAFWDDSILPSITEYIRIPNKSPAFDPQWVEHGYMEDAVTLMVAWAKPQLAGFPGATLEVVRLPGRTPLIFIEVPGDSDDTVLLYGHLDKQPEMKGWADGMGPWIPVRKGDKLYGRGGADDGYAAFSSLTALQLLQQQGKKRARCVVIIEACEESGSYDLPYYIDALKDRIGKPSLVVCLDSGCGNYDQLWCTTSLRGLVLGTLEIEVLTEGVHSGDGSGVIPSSFRIARLLLDRLEDAQTGQIKPVELSVTIPRERILQAARSAEVLGDEVYSKFPLVPGLRPVSTDPAELILNRTWRPALATTGADGIPAIADAGNVLRPRTALKLSLRVPPTLDAPAAEARVKALLEKDPPYGARVRFKGAGANAGWDAPALAAWLDGALEQASQRHFGKPPVFMGEGGSIPFMGMLGKKFPEAQFFITGVLGPGSNAHGPNEFLDLPTARRLTLCVADVLAAHATRS